MTTTDPIELIVADGLRKAGVAFVHESDNKGQMLDFYLPQQQVFIECKQFSTDRTAAQIAGIPNVIVVQGRIAAETFAALLHDRSVASEHD